MNEIAKLYPHTGGILPPSDFDEPLDVKDLLWLRRIP